MGKLKRGICGKNASFVDDLLLSQAQLENRSSADGKEVMQRMVHWTLQCMDLEAARQLPMAVRTSEHAMLMS